MGFNKRYVSSLNKRYSGDCSRHAEKTVQKCIKLTDKEIDIVKTLFPNKSLSYGIRTLIHYADAKESNNL